MKINKALIEQFMLEVGRIAAIAVVPVGISMLETKTLDWHDLALHESDVVQKGITRF